MGLCMWPVLRTFMYFDSRTKLFYVIYIIMYAIVFLFYSVLLSDFTPYKS